MERMTGGMNPNDFASLLSSFGGNGGGAARLTQGLHRGGRSTGTSTQQGTAQSLLDTSAQQTADSRPNIAPVGTRSTGTIATSTSRSSGSSSKLRNGGTSSSSSAMVPADTVNSTTSNESKGGPIQISALTSVLTNLSSNTTQETEATASSSKPVIDLCDIVTNEVRSMQFSFYFYFINILF
jgi:hypothetical protein